MVVLLNYTISSLEQNTSYDIQVRAESDEGTSEWSATRAGTTTANVAPVIAAISPISVSENSIATLVTVSATDNDTDDNIESYGIVAAADGAQFSIGSSTGVLSFKVAPNYEDPKDVEVSDPANDANNNEYIVIVEATGGENARALTTTATVTVTVTDVNTEAPGAPAAPTIAQATFNSLKVSWSAPTNTGPEISSYDVRHILTSATDKADANWTVVEDAWTSGDGTLEYTIGSLSSNTSYDIQVRAESDEGTSDWSATVVGTTQQNVAPVIAAISPISVAENSIAALVTVSATDNDTDDNIESYGIVDAADGSQFEIDDQTGVLKFKVAPNYEDPKDVAITDPVNAEENNEYIVIVSATGGTGARALTTTATVTVTVTDVDTEAPGAPAVPTIAQATFNSLKVAWTAPTNTGPEISAYDVRHILTSASASDKADDSKWTVVEDAWKAGDGALEYTISSLSQDTSYDIQVRAESDEGTGGWSSSVSGTTTANVAPVIATISPISVAENSIAALVTVSATDNDADDDIESYGIVDTADGAQFSIVEDTGVLSFKAAPNYEDPKDVAVTTPANDANNNEYIVVVTATGGTGDRALAATQTVTVTVTDVDTEAPGVSAAPTIAQATFNSLKVSWSAPTNTGPEIGSYDVRHILTSASAADKADDTKWTVATDAWTSGDGALEYTIGSLNSNTSYDIQVRAESDEGTSDWSATRAGTTVQNVAPVIAAISPISVAENSTAALVTVSAMDEDSADDIERYGIATGADGAQFSIVEDTGVLSFKSAPNYEDPKDVEVSDPANDANNNEYIVIVEATGGTGERALTTTATVTVNVTDETEAPGTPDAPTIAQATFNSLKVSWTVPTNTGPEISAYDVRHILTSASAADKAVDANWTVVEDAWTSNNGGDLEYTIGSLSSNTSYDIQVRAESDEGTSSWSATRAGTTTAERGASDCCYLTDFCS